MKELTDLQRRTLLEAQDTLYGETKLDPEADGRCLRGLRNRGLVEGEKPHVYLTDAGKGIITDIEGRIG